MKIVEHVRRRLNQTTIAFFSLLAAVILLTVLFASGWLRFGQSGTVAYIVYVIAGLLSATLCYGILEATGTFEGQYHQARLKLGGSVVALVLVAGGGGAYERYLRTPETFDLRIRFISSTRSPQPLTGTVRLFLGAENHEGKLDHGSDVLFQGIASGWKGTPVHLSLEAPPYRLTDKSLIGLKVACDTIDILVEKDQALVATYGGTLSTPPPIRKVPRAKLELIGTPCHVLTDENGYFSFKDCDEAERLVNPSVRIILPGDRECPEPVNLQPLPRLTDITISSNCYHRSNPAQPSIRMPLVKGLF